MTVDGQPGAFPFSRDDMALARALLLAIWEDDPELYASLLGHGVDESDRYGVLAAMTRLAFDGWMRYVAAVSTVDGHDLNSVELHETARRVLAAIFTQAAYFEDEQ